MCNAPSTRKQQMETLDPLEPYVLSILRIMVGLLFMQHGLVKLFGFPTGAGFPAFLSLTWFEGCIEMIGGGLIVVGLFTRWAAFITSGEMAIGYFMVHAPKGFFPYANGGKAGQACNLLFVSWREWSIAKARCSIAWRGTGAILAHSAIHVSREAACGPGDERPHEASERRRSARIVRSNH